LLDFDPGLFGYYDGFYNQVHIDEKRFFVSKENKHGLKFENSQVNPLS
jgi:hypothetical protein